MSYAYRSECKKGVSTEEVSLISDHVLNDWINITEAQQATLVEGLSFGPVVPNRGKKEPLFIEPSEYIVPLQSRSVVVKFSFKISLMVRLMKAFPRTIETNKRDSMRNVASKWQFFIGEFFHRNFIGLERVYQTRQRLKVMKMLCSIYEKQKRYYVRYNRPGIENGFKLKLIKFCLDNYGELIKGTYDWHFQTVHGLNVFRDMQFYFPDGVFTLAKNYTDPSLGEAQSFSDWFSFLKDFPKKATDIVDFMNNIMNRISSLSFGDIFDWFGKKFSGTITEKFLAGMLLMIAFGAIYQYCAVSFDLIGRLARAIYSTLFGIPSTYFQVSEGEAHGEAQSYVSLSAACVSFVFLALTGSTINLAGKFSVIRSASAMAESFSNDIMDVLNLIFKKIFGVDWFLREGAVEEITGFHLKLTELVRRPKIRELVGQDAKLAEEVKTLFKESVTYRQSCVTLLTGGKCRQSLALFQLDLKTLEELYEVACTNTWDVHSRKVPIFIYLVGEPGMGKTTLINYLCEAYYSTCVKKGFKPEIYTGDYTPARMYPRKDEDYWENYYGQPITIYNEIFCKKNADESSKIASELLCAIENTSFPVPMAFQRKGSVFFTSDLVIATSNSFAFDDVGLANPGAFKRRIHFPIVVDRNLSDTKVNPDLNKAWNFSLHPSVRSDPAYHGVSKFLPDGTFDFGKLMTAIMCEHTARLNEPSHAMKAKHIDWSEYISESKCAKAARGEIPAKDRSKRRRRDDKGKGKVKKSSDEGPKPPPVPSAKARGEGHMYFGTDEDQDNLDAFDACVSEDEDESTWMLVDDAHEFDFDLDYFIVEDMGLCLRKPDVVQDDGSARRLASFSDMRNHVLMWKNCENKITQVNRIRAMKTQEMKDLEIVSQTIRDYAWTETLRGVDGMLNESVVKMMSRCDTSVKLESVGSMKQWFERLVNEHDPLHESYDELGYHPSVGNYITAGVRGQEYYVLVDSSIKECRIKTNVKCPKGPGWYWANFNFVHEIKDGYIFRTEYFNMTTTNGLKEFIKWFPEFLTTDVNIDDIVTFSDLDDNRSMSVMRQVAVLQLLAGEKNDVPAWWPVDHISTFYDCCMTYMTRMISKVVPSWIPVPVVGIGVAFVMTHALFMGIKYCIGKIYGWIPRTRISQEEYGEISQKKMEKMIDTIGEAQVGSNKKQSTPKYRLRMLKKNQKKKEEVGESHSFEEQLSERAIKFLANTRPVSFESFSGETVETQLLFITNTCFVTVDHAYRVFDVMKIHIYDVQFEKAMSYTPSQFVITKLDGRDLLRFVLKPVKQQGAVPFAGVPSILTSISTEIIRNGRLPIRLARMDDANGEMVNVMKGRDVFTHTTRSITTSPKAAPQIVSTLYDYYLIHNGGGEAGCCICPVITADPVYGNHPIIGVHVGAIHGDSIVAPLLQSDFRDMRNVGESQMASEISFFDTTCVQKVVAGTCSYYPPKHISSAPMKSKLVPSMASNLLKMENNLAPAKLNFQAYTNFYAKYEKFPVRTAPAILRELMRDKEDLFRPFFKFKDKYTYKLLSSKEACFGSPDDHIESMDFSTAGGFLGSTALRRDFFDIEKQELKPELERLVNFKMTEMMKGNVFPQFVKDCAKDELRDLERVLQNKTRIFCVGNLVDFIVAKRIFGHPIAYMKEHMVTCVSSIGVNVHGYDWKVLYETIFKHGRNRVFGGDLSTMDISTQRFMADVMLLFFCWLIPELEINETLYDLFSAACYNICTTVHVGPFGSYLYTRGNSSGNFMTGFFNSLTCYIYIRCCFEHARAQREEETMSFSEAISLAVYGDDNLGSVHKDIDWFNNLVIAQLMKELFGVDFTDPSKGAITEPFLKEDEQVFLSRHFVERNGFLFAPLEKDSIFASLHWIRQNKDFSDWEQLEKNMSNAALEMTHYPEDEQKIFMDEMNRICSELGRPSGFRSCELWRNIRMNTYSDCFMYFS